jgi:hypothetical protein
LGEVHYWQRAHRVRWLDSTIGGVEMKIPTKITISEYTWNELFSICEHAMKNCMLDDVYTHHPGGRPKTHEEVLEMVIANLYALKTKVEECE